jgi:hypothetical protein
LKNWASEALQQFNGDSEKINDSRQTALSKRLLDKVNYMKTVHSLDIAKEIGLDVLRKKCTGFDD